jgi:hypothetical protein
VVQVLLSAFEKKNVEGQKLYQIQFIQNASSAEMFCALFDLQQAFWPCLLLMPLGLVVLALAFRRCEDELVVIEF